MSISQIPTVKAVARPITLPGIYEHLVLQTLQRMKCGCLQIELYNGETIKIGTPFAGIEARIRVKSPRFFKRCALFGGVGLGESYVGDEWETDDIVQVISWFVLNLEYAPTHLGTRVTQKQVNLLTVFNRIQHRLRQNSVKMSRKNIAEHYDLGNEFYELWLDPTMAYSSARFTAEQQSLEEGQISKFDSLCRNLRLKPTDHLLEIGTGWGGFSLHAAKQYGCRITTITISEAQFKYAQERMRNAGVSDRVNVELRDYRHVDGKYDKIVSIEMMEALGDRYLETYCAQLHRCLKGEGLVGLQYITVPDSRHAELRKGIDWMQRHIFPGSLLLSIGRVNAAMNRTGNLSLYGLEDMGASYAKTLRLWRDSFNRQNTAVRRLGFNDAFIRKWNFYLAYCEAGFTMKNISVVQAIYTRPNNLSLP